jgi:hypothetical protein
MCAEEESLEALVTKLEAMLKQQQTATTATTAVTQQTKSSSSGSGCCDCTSIAKLQKSIADLVTSANDVFSSCSSPPTPIACLGHYWPIGNQSVTDTVTGKSATSNGSPRFISDRNGVADGALWVNGSAATAWQLPTDTYFQGDTTVTMWLKKSLCQSGSYGDFFFFNFKIFQS